MITTQNSLTQALAEQLVAQQSSIAQLQEQLSSGQALRLPSDNPTAVTQVLALSNQASQLTSWQTNADMANSWLNTASSTANSVLELMQSAQSLLLQASNQAAQNSLSYQAIGSQIQGIVGNLELLANTQYAGRAIFAGNSASSQAFDASGNYLGDSNSPTVVIGPGSGVGQTVGISVTGPEMFGVGASNVFATLTAAVNALSTGTPSSSSISTALSGISANIATAQHASVILGNASKEVSNISSNLSAQISAVQNSQANLEDTNVVMTTTQLQLEMANYHAALWAASAAIPETLAKFVAP